MTVTLSDIVAGLVWLLAAAVLGVVDLIAHARRVRVTDVPQPDGPAAGQAQEGDAIGEQAECVTVPGEVSGKGSLARDVRSQPVQPPAEHTGIERPVLAGGPVTSSACREEPERSRGLLGAVEGGDR